MSSNSLRDFQGVQKLWSEIQANRYCYYVQMDNTALPENAVFSVKFNSLNLEFLNLQIKNISSGFTKFPYQKLRQIGPGVHELWSNIQHQTSIYMYIYFACLFVCPFVSNKRQNDRAQILCGISWPHVWFIDYLNLKNLPATKLDFLFLY